MISLFKVVLQFGKLFKGLCKLLGSKIDVSFMDFPGIVPHNGLHKSRGNTGVM